MPNIASGETLRHPEKQGKSSEYLYFSMVRLVSLAQNSTNGVCPMLKKKPTYEELEKVQYEELKASKTFIETALNSLTDSLYVIRTADFIVLGANKAFSDAIGLDANSIIGKHCYELTHHRSTPCADSHHPCPLMETLKTGQPSTMAHIHFDSTGGERFFEVSAYPIRDERGEIHRIVHVDREITERKKYEYGLTAAKESLKQQVQERTAELIMKNRQLEEEVGERKIYEQRLKTKGRKLELKSEQLTQLNATLKILLKQRDVDKREVEEKIILNVKELIIPYLETLKTRKLDQQSLSDLKIIESNLNNIISPFTHNLSSKFIGLTHKEIQVANMLREGKGTKEIAKIMSVSISAIKLHRYHIRNKLGLIDQKVNLRSYLSSLQ
jgi:PAS domain S-box-containing protein